MKTDHSHRKEPNTSRKISNMETDQSLVEDYYYDCELCSASFLSQEDIEDHIERIHSRIPTRIYQCNFCSNRFLNDGDLVEHIRSNHRRYQYVCWSDSDGSDDEDEDAVETDEDRNDPDPNDSDSSKDSTDNESNKEDNKEERDDQNPNYKNSESPREEHDEEVDKDPSMVEKDNNDPPDITETDHSPGNRPNKETNHNLGREITNIETDQSHVEESVEEDEYNFYQCELCVEAYISEEHLKTHLIRRHGYENLNADQSTDRVGNTDTGEEADQSHEEESVEIGSDKKTNKHGNDKVKAHHSFDRVDSTDTVEEADQSHEGESVEEDKYGFY